MKLPRSILILFITIVLTFIGILSLFFRLFSLNINSFSFGYVESELSLKTRAINDFLDGAEDFLLVTNELPETQTLVTACASENSTLENSTLENSIPEGCQKLQAFAESLTQIAFIDSVAFFDDDSAFLTYASPVNSDQEILYSQLVNLGSVQQDLIVLPVETYRSQRYNQIYFSEIFDFQGRPALLGILVLYDEQGSIMGSMFAELNVGFFDDILLDSSLFHARGQTYLVSSSKVMLTDSRFSSESTRFSQIIDTENANACLDQRQAPETWEVTRDYRGLEVLGSYSYIPKTNWCLINEVEVREIDRIQDLTFKIIYLVALVFFFGLFYFLETIIHTTSSLQEKQQELESSLLDRAKFETAVNNANDTIFIVDPDFKVVYMNDSTEKITGFSRQTSIGIHLRDLWLSRLNQNKFDEVMDHVFGRQQPGAWELVTTRKDGSTFPSEFFITPIVDEHGANQFALVIEHDISARVQLDKLKNEFIAITSHELRTPLSVIQGYVSLLQDEKAGKITDNQRRMLGRIDVTSASLIHFVNEMLDLSKLEHGTGELDIEYTTFELADVIKTVMHDFTSFFIEKNLESWIDIRTHNRVHSDQSLIHRVLTNLVANAVKFTETGSIGIVVRDVDTAGMVRVEVHDTGIGIPEEYRSFIFEKFSRIQNHLKRDQSSGTGLGLPISKQIIEALGGRIDFEARDQGGTIFFIEIPRERKEG